MTTLYILGGAVAVAALVFIVMIISEIVRRPQLPDVTSFEPPPSLQRVIRALTPLPVATQPPVSTRPTPVPIARVTAPVTTAPLPAVVAPPKPVAAPPVVAPPVVAPPVVAAPPAPAVAPRTLPPRPPPASAAAPAAAPAPKPASAYPVFRIPPQFARDTRSPEIRRPLYPKRSRTLRRVILGLFATVLLASGAAVAYPSLLDPICDDYEWFGAEQAQVVREQARDAHAAVADFVESL